MSPALRASARFWLTGLALALVGVAINRLVAPQLSAVQPRTLVAVLGQLIALGGLGVILFGIRRRLRLAECATTRPLT